MRGQIKVLVEGMPLLELEPVALDLRRVVNRIPGGRITFQLKGDPAGKDRWQRLSKAAKQCAPGRQVVLRFKPERGGEVEFFKGLTVTPLNLRVDRAEAGGGIVASLDLAHAVQTLTVSHRSQVFEGKSDAAILREMLTGTKITLGKADGMDAPHEQMVQWSCSDWSWMRSRAAAHPVWLLVGDQALNLFQPDIHTASLGLTLKAERGTAEDDVAIIEQEWALDARTVPKELTLAYWNIETQKTEQVSARSLTLGEGALALPSPLSSQPWRLVCRLALTQSEAQALANARLLALHLQAVQGQVVIAGNANTLTLEPGQRLELKGFDGFDGKGLITEVHHRWSRDPGLRTTLKVGEPSPLVGLADGAGGPRVTGQVIGVVDHFKQDPAGHGRLRVRVPGLCDAAKNEQPIWARPGFSYASKNKGLCLYPEPGDEVVLAFLEEDPRFPVIVSALHNPKNPPPFPPSEENAHKGLVLDDDQQLVFDVEKKLASWMGGKERLELDANAGMTLHSQHQLAIDGETVALTGNKAVTIEGKAQSVTLDAPRITVTANGQLVLEGKSGAQLKGSTVDLSQ